MENALVAIAAAREIGIGIEAIKKGLSKLRVPGRMEVVESKDGRVICVVDYASQPAFVPLAFLVGQARVSRQPGYRSVWCAGGKAQERREQLPREAAPYSDLMIFANEDPAHEDPMKVCRELAEHVPDDTPNKIILDREAAVCGVQGGARGVRQPDAPTIVLLLAKGDEELMHVGDEFVPIESDLRWPIA
ncbi:MAG: glutamate ligase domain-containing protein [Collinsella sp.]